MSTAVFTVHYILQQFLNVSKTHLRIGASSFYKFYHNFRISLFFTESPRHAFNAKANNIKHC